MWFARLVLNGYTNHKSRFCSAEDERLMKVNVAQHRGRDQKLKILNWCLSF